MAIYYLLHSKNKAPENGDENGRSEKEILDRVNEASDGLALAILPTINSLAGISKKFEGHRLRPNSYLSFSDIHRQQAMDHCGLVIIVSMSPLLS
jgi:hypothetical protein